MSDCFITEEVVTNRPTSTSPYTIVILREPAAAHPRLIQMLRLSLALLLLAGGSALAASGAENDTAWKAKCGAKHDAVWAEPAPTAAEVVGELYEFDRFQQDAIDSADSRGNDEIQTFALARADAAQKRDKALAEVRKHVAADPAFDRQARPARADELAALQISEGPDYVRSFYAVEVAEHRSAVALLRRYLASPDNRAVRGFVAEQLPLLQSALEDAAAALADK